MPIQCQVNYASQTSIKSWISTIFWSSSKSPLLIRQNHDSFMQGTVSVIKTRSDMDFRGNYLCHINREALHSLSIEEGWNYFSKTPPLASMHWLSFLLNLSTEHAFLIAWLDILLHSEFTASISDALLEWLLEHAVCKMWFQHQLSSGVKSGAVGIHSSLVQKSLRFSMHHICVSSLVCPMMDQSHMTPYLQFTINKGGSTYNT